MEHIQQVIIGATSRATVGVRHTDDAHRCSSIRVRGMSRLARYLAEEVNEMKIFWLKSGERVVPLE